MIVLKAIYWICASVFLAGMGCYMIKWKRPAQDRVEYRPVEKVVKVPVEKDHVTCLQCTHGTRDQGQTGRVYCRRFGCQMMPKAYCSMAELNTDLVIRDKVQEAERLLNRSEGILDRYRDYAEMRNAYAAYQSTYAEELANEAIREQLDELKKQYSRSLADQVRWRF